MCNNKPGNIANRDNNNNNNNPKPKSSIRWCMSERSLNGPNDMEARKDSRKSWVKRNRFVI